MSSSGLQNKVWGSLNFLWWLQQNLTEGDQSLGQWSRDQHMEQYILLGRVGEGAHGIVFKAKHVEVTGLNRTTGMEWFDWERRQQVRR